MARDNESMYNIIIMTLNDQKETRGKNSVWSRKSLIIIFHFFIEQGLRHEVELFSDNA